MLRKQSQRTWMRSTALLSIVVLYSNTISADLLSRDTLRENGRPSRERMKNDHIGTVASEKKPTSSPGDKKPAVETFTGPSLSFEPNRGKANGSVNFVAHGPGGGIVLSSLETTLLLDKTKRETKNSYRRSRNLASPSFAAVRMKLQDANPNNKAIGLDELPGKTNYFLGNDSSKWRTDIPNYKRVKYEAVYPGIDVIYYGNQNQLEYDFVVAPYADPNSIKIRFDDRCKLKISRNGDLLIVVDGIQLRQLKPIIYQSTDAGRIAVSGRYVLRHHEVSFEIGAYDQSKPLIIDPLLSYSSYLWGGQGLDIALDSARNIYLVGRVTTAPIPLVDPVQSANAGNTDIFIQKFDPTGSILLFSSYLGGSDRDDGNGYADPSIAVDAAGNIYVRGTTSSTDFPTVNAIQPIFGGNLDAYVSKINASGNQLIYSTYLGGSSSEEWGDIAVDSLGNAYVTGSTYSTNFPTHNPLMPPACDSFNRDVFVSALNPTGSFIYSTHLGSGTQQGDEAGMGIAVDAAGNAYVTGKGSPTYPTTPGAYQTNVDGGFITKINADGSALLYSTHLSGASNAQDIAIDSSGNAYIMGYTSVSELPAVNAFQPSRAGATDVFVAKVDATGASLLYASYLGGSGSESGGAIAVDSDGNAYLTGSTIGGFPLVNPVQVNMGGGGGYPDAFVAKVDASGTSLVFSTYLGGTGQDEGNGIAVDSEGNAYVIGSTNAPTDFPKVNAYKTTGPGGFLSKYTGLKTYKISGHITDATGAGFSAVTVNLSGGQSRTTQTNLNGDYTFNNVPSAANYTVTPVKSGFSFSPTNKSFTNLSADQVADFTTLFYSVSGRVTDSLGAGINAATLTLSGSQATTVQTDSNGYYTFPNVAAHGNYTITPSKLSYDLTYTFTPASRALTNVSANQTGLDFSTTISTVSALNPIADTYVQDGASANTNFGTVTPLQLKTDNQTGQRRDVYFKFDLSSLSRSITAVKLRIFSALSAAGSVSTSAYSVSDTTWGETTINWNNKKTTSALSGAGVTVNSTTFAAYDIDITTYVKGEKAAGRDTVSLALHNGSNSTPYILLNSREAASNKPQLVVTTSNNSNNGPTVSLSSPNGTSFASPANIPLSANASDADGTISKVEFYAGTALVGTATSSPYNVTWSNVPLGTYSLTAIATDNNGAVATSPAVSVSVNNGNSLPTNVSFISPLGGTNFGPGTNITLSATARDLDGSITKVEFFDGAALVGTSTVPTTGDVYTVTWTNASVGSHALTAQATDNSLGATQSSIVNINVVGATGLLPAADAYVKDGSSASINFGTATELQTQLGPSGSNRESHLRFDLTTVGSIVQAKLRVYGKLSDASANNIRVGVYSVSSTTWVETGSGSITWNNKPASGGTALSTVTVKDNTARWYEFDVSAYVQSEKSLTHNLVSFGLKSVDSSTPYVTFGSRDATAASDNRPQLVIWTTQPRNALLVVGSTTLNAGDNAIKTRLQNLGFTVTAKQAGTNNNAINTSDADGKVLVLISSSVTDANVLAKFRYVPIPVINSEANVLDDMGMTGVTTNDLGTTTATQTQLNIVTPSHPMAAGLSGLVTVVTSASNFSWGAPNTNAAKIATVNGDANKSVIFGYEKGVMMPGLNAPARRVALFMSDLTAGSFNTNGGSLFDASVKWATDVVTAPTIQAVTPTSGPIGTTITITGFNFGTTQGTSTVSFNGVLGTPTNWNDLAIVVPVPVFATTGPVLMVVNGVSSNTVILAVGDLDSDADGLPDWWEIQYFGNLSQTANADPDGDSLTNLQEFQQGRNPTKNAQPDEGAGVNLKIYTPLGPPN